MVFMFPPVINNIWYAQINFMVLLMLLLFWKDRTSFRGGVWLAIGVVLKPYVAILFLYLTVKRQWRVVGGMLSMLGALSILSLLAFGSATFISYFASNFSSRLPVWYFSELANGSLYAAILRVTISLMGEGGLGTARGIFVILAVPLAGFLLWLVNQLDTSNNEWAMAITLPVALLLYPITAANYCVALLIPLFLLWMQREKIPGGVWSIAAFTALEFAFFGYHSGWSQFVFIGIAFSSLVSLTLGLFFVAQQRHRLSAAG
jgi:hypothetical protein